RRVTVNVTGKNGGYPGVAGDEPLEAILVLGGQTDALAGGCGESAFVAADRAVNRLGTSLNGRQSLAFGERKSGTERPVTRRGAEDGAACSDRRLQTSRTMGTRPFASAYASRWTAICR